jgi:hypothetical protein
MVDPRLDGIARTGDHRAVADMVRRLRWPFPGGEFPEDLGAVVQRTVLDGRLPALVVAHADDGDWMVGDGVNDPNEPGATIATHMRHVVDRDPTVGALAELPPGSRADRESAAHPWVVSHFAYEGD